MELLEVWAPKRTAQKSPPMKTASMLRRCSPWATHGDGAVLFAESAGVPERIVHPLLDPPVSLLSLWNETELATCGPLYLLAPANAACRPGLVDALRPPHVLGPDVTEYLPPNLRPQPRYRLEVAGQGMRSLLRRDAVTWCSWDRLMCGERRWRLLPPETQAQQLEARVGDLACGVSPLDAFVHGIGHEVVQGPGDIVIVPPGWWFQTHSEEPTLAVSSHYATEASLPHIAAALAIWADEDLEVRAPKGGRSQSSHEPWLPEPLRAVAAARPPDDAPSKALPLHLNFLPVTSAPDFKATEYPDLPALMRRLLEVHVPFVYGSCAVPPDAEEWKPQEVELFVASLGLLRPSSRIQMSWAPRYSNLERLWREGLPPVRQDADGVVWTRAPRVFWTFWAQGADRLPRFRRFCLHSWQVQNPGWAVVLLDDRSVLRYVERESLPNRWDEMAPEHRT